MRNISGTTLVLAGLVSAFLLGGRAVAAPDKEYVGSDRCKTCHAAQFDTWKKTYHSKMVRKKDEGILKAVVENWAGNSANPGPTKSNVDGKPRTLEDVVFVIGSKWKQRFLVKNEATGNHQFLDRQWNRMTSKWEPYGQSSDWETQCTTCHATGFRLTSYDPAKPQEQKWSMAEQNVGCEACHGPGARHVNGPNKKNIYSFSGKSVEERTLVCGYCHIRGENLKYKTAQGNHSEYMPAPVVGDSYKAGDDWRKWYPEAMVIPGVHAKDRIDGAYEGDLKGMYKVDDIAKAGGFYDAGKHHQQYQEYIQSSHYKKNIMGCNGCHSSHAGKDGKVVVAKDSCAKCHDASFTVEKYMPGSGSTAAGLTVRTHTFNKNQTRATSGVTAAGDPEYYRK
jgi:hypothetical protein